MTVAELIEELEWMPPDVAVRVRDTEGNDVLDIYRVRNDLKASTVWLVS